jgi:hypothetical protein
MFKRVGFIFIVAIVIAIILINSLEEAFNSQQWLSEPLQRYEMVDDLIESQFLIGKPKVEVLEILGPPDSKSSSKKDAFIYNIGDPPSFFPSQKEYLFVVFNNEQVDKVTLAVD